MFQVLTVMSAFLPLILIVPELYFGGSVSQKCKYIVTKTSRFI